MDNNKPTQPRQIQTDLSAILHSYMERWPLFLISVIAFTALGIAFCYMRQTRFEVQANVLITDDDKEADLMRASGLSDLFSSSASADGELEIIKSYTLYRNVVKELGLNTKYIIRHNILKRTEVFEDTPLLLTPPAELADTLNGNLHFKVRVAKGGKASVRVYNIMGKKVFEKKDITFPASLATPYGDFRLETTAEYNPKKKLAMSIWMFSYDAAAENLQKEVRCYIPSKKADVITVSYLATNTAQGKKIVNEIVDEYNDRGIEQSRKKARKIADFIDNRLVSLTSDLAATELDVEEYKKKNKLTNITADAEYMMTKRGAIESRLRDAESVVSILELTREMLSDPNERDAMLPIPPAMENSEEIISDYNKLVLKRMQLEKTAKPGNTTLSVLNDKIAALRKNIFVSLDKAIATARLQLSEIKESNSESQARLSQVPRQEREFLDISRQQEIKQTLYLFMLREREQTNMRIANALPKGQIIDRAFAKTKPSGMGKVTLVLVFALVGFCAVPVLLYLRDLLRNHVNTADELKKLTSLPVVGQIPAAKDADGQQNIEPFITLATALKFTGGDSENRIITVTAASKGQGATFTAINLARAYAATGNQTVLLELNFRDSAIASELGIKPQNGSAMLLTQQPDNLSQAIVRNPSGDNFDVIVAESQIPNAPLLLSSQKLKGLIDKLSSSYRYVIIDAAPISYLADIMPVASESDVTLIVVRANVTTLGQIRHINSFARDSFLSNVETVVDGSKPARKILGIKL